LDTVKNEHAQIPIAGSFVRLGLSAVMAQSKFQCMLQRMVRRHFVSSFISLFNSGLRQTRQQRGQMRR